MLNKVGKIKRRLSLVTSEGAPPLQCKAADFTVLKGQRKHLSTLILYYHVLLVCYDKHRCRRLLKTIHKVLKLYVKYST